MIHPIIPLLDHGYISLVESWGSDERIIEAARMSTNKGFQGWGHPDGGEGCNDNGSIYSGICDRGTKACTLTHVKVGDEKLLRYLWEHNHATPFEMAGLTIEVQAPIMVFREWHRHRTQSYNEMSGRYTELPDLYYIPDVSRMQLQSKSNKQGSAEVSPIAEDLQGLIRESTRASRDIYETLLSHGIAKEIARLVLPVNQYSRMRASANLRNWLGFLTLRMAPGAQWEIRQYADAVASIIAERFPRTYGLFNEGR